jgi:hypothetical protein
MRRILLIVVLLVAVSLVGGALPSTTNSIQATTQAMASAASCSSQPTGEWLPVSTLSSPVARSQPGLVWTGHEVLMWGGCCGSRVTPADGGRYDPVQDAWTPMSDLGAPAGTSGYVMAWTGTELLVWTRQERGFQEPQPPGEGGRYDPGRDRWKPMSTEGAPVPYAGMLGFWTGEELLVWAVDTGAPERWSDGARYDPRTDRWRPMSPAPIPAFWFADTATWTGSELLVWGRRPGSRHDLRWEAATDTWGEITREGAPSGYAQAVWTGERALVWTGTGVSPSQIEPQGGLYDPRTDTWSPMRSDEAAPWYNQAAITWTGREFITWGGSLSRSDSRSVQAHDDGAAYDPATDTWRRLPPGPLTARSGPSAIWTGQEVVILGGFELAFPGRIQAPERIGARYIPPG